MKCQVLYSQKKMGKKNRILSAANVTGASKVKICFSFYTALVFLFLFSLPFSCLISAFDM